MICNCKLLSPAFFQQKFNTIKLGDSSTLRPGEFVVAMGSPLRLSNTVTSGIVSAVHRSGGDLSRHLSQIQYIQTDAAINVCIHFLFFSVICIYRVQGKLEFPLKVSNSQILLA